MMASCQYRCLLPEDALLADAWFRYAELFWHSGFGTKVAVLRMISNSARGSLH